MTLPVFAHYRSEFIRSLNQTVSILPMRCEKESMSQGLTAQFDILDLSGDMSTRGVDGNLPRLTRNDTQKIAQLEEYGGTERINNFDAFKSQSAEREKMYVSMATRWQRRMDRECIAELTNATNAPGAAITGSPDTIGALIATFEENEVPVNPEDVTIIGTPKMRMQLMKHAQYTSSDYIGEKRPFIHDEAIYENEKKIKTWMDVGWVFSPLLKGIGTATAECYIFHRRALGCARPGMEVKSTTGFNTEHHYDFASTSGAIGWKILQEVGVRKFIHDDLAA